MALVEGRWDLARAALAAAVSPLPTVSLPLVDCDGLVLGADLVARCALPSFDTSAMDGWAVRGLGPWLVVGASLAGRPWPKQLATGQAVRVATGAMVPQGADAVIRSEEGRVVAGAQWSADDANQLDGDAANQGLLLAAAPQRPTHIRPAGEECVSGDVLAAAGTIVTPAVIGLAAASGHDWLEVRPRPRAALVLFGDELAFEGVPGPGLVRDSLGPQVPAWLWRMGVEAVAVDRATDTMPAHVAAIERAAQRAEVVLTTGGTAAGPVDHLHAAIAACDGELVVDRVAVRPGHPMLAGRVRSGATWLLGLPGNPQSAIVALLTLGLPIFDGLSGRRPAKLAEVRLAAALPAPAHEDRLVLGTVADGCFHAASHLGSGMLRGLASATGFAVLPPGGAPAGAAVRWLPLPL